MSSRDPSPMDTVLIEAIRRMQDKMSSDSEKVMSHLFDIDKTLVKQEENLRQHMYRTELNEMALADLREFLKPVRSHITKVDQIIYVAKWCTGSVIGASALLASVIKILEHFKV